MSWISHDLKPANILFDRDDNPYIADFDIAKLLESSATFASTGIIGTPADMSPERARGGAGGAAGSGSGGGDRAGQGSQPALSDSRRAGRGNTHFDIRDRQATGHQTGAEKAGSGYVVDLTSKTLSETQGVHARPQERL